MSEKKRKRQSDQGNEKPAKKAATQLSAQPAPGTVKVTVVPNSAEHGPIIASTPGLSFPRNILLAAYKKRKDPTSRHSLPNEVLLQSSAHPRLDYTAREELEWTGGLLKHYVGVYDGQTGELKVIEAPRVVVKSTLRSETEEMRQKNKQTPIKPTNMALRQELGMEFGTKKAKKALASITENAITPRKPRDAANTDTPTVDALDAGAKAILQSMQASTSDMPSRDAMNAAADDAKPRPKANLDATTPAEAYPLDALISPDELRAVDIKAWQDAVKAGENVQVTSRFVAKRLDGIGKSKDTKKLRVLRYVYILIEFYNALKANRDGGKRLPQRDELRKRVSASDVLLDGVKRKYAAGAALTKWHVDNLMTHLAALSLIVDEFETDFWDLREDLRMEPKKMSQYYHEIGCKVNPLTEKERTARGLSKAEANVRKVAKLKLPLSFPKQRQLAARR
ncbi:RNA polymerase I associated factor, A49-like protein [Patellaria atrata CBS 101060]|uniref:RNA polymerase I associated factor, A49-like protein n=1 Tax=Patellaria atrata CBS 101060 TaxID=1346257 RepID=A0A9P4SGS8_9PEZI|nr:RNA polymerase I associated factor, A49-like protein [Patellaria atrata CBS 101060]